MRPIVIAVALAALLCAAPAAAAPPCEAADNSELCAFAPGGGVQRACLPQMLPLPASVGAAFHAVEGYEACPPGVGEIPTPPDAPR